MKKTISKILALAITSVVAIGALTSCTVNLHSYEDGDSAYEVAVANGFDGTEREWLNSLKAKSVSDVKVGYEADATGKVYTVFTICYNDGSSSVTRTAAPEAVINEEQLAAALGAGESILLGANINVSENVLMRGGIFDGAGLTVDGTAIENSYYNCMITTLGGTVSNVRLYGGPRGIGTGSSGTYKLEDNLILRNVGVDGGTYAINIGGGEGNNLYVYDSTLYGWSSYSGLGLAYFENVTFGQGETDYSYLRMYDDSTFVGCKFEEGFKLGVNSDGFEDGTPLNISFTDCYYGDTLITVDNFMELLTDSSDSDAVDLVECHVIINGEDADLCLCDVN